MRLIKSRVKLGGLVFRRGDIVPDDVESEQRMMTLDDRGVTLDLSDDGTGAPAILDGGNANSTYQEA